MALTPYDWPKETKEDERMGAEETAGVKIRVKD
jgi:hypothetical protein